MNKDRMISITQRLIIDEWRAFCILGFQVSPTGLSPEYIRIYIKPYDGRLDQEVRSHARTVTKLLEKGDSLTDIVEDHTKESIVGNILHYVKNNMEDIIACKEVDKEVKLSTDPYRKIK
tara:strand:+ start:1016 stop:1372 length:357 start_codon:yes stop_codon:yes gene_type:complete